MRRAIIVGCSEYKDSRIGSLQFAHKDAERFATALTAYCGMSSADMVLCTSPGESPADRSSIGSALADLKEKLAKEKPADIIFFFFSGHGFRCADDGRDYLLPYDAIFNNLKYNAICIDDVTSMLGECRARCVVLVLDACRNIVSSAKGSVEGELAPIDPATVNVRGMVAFFSCRPSERSFEASSLTSGIFTQALVEGLGTEGQCRTVRELDSFLHLRVPALGPLHNRPVQTPLARVEPLSMADICVVSRERMLELSANMHLRRELHQSSKLIPPAQLVQLNAEIASLDIGSSNSLCAYPAGDQKVVFAVTPQGRRHMPSAVLVWPDMDYEVGQPAIDKAETSTAVTLRNYKRKLSYESMLNAHGRDISPGDLITVTVATLIKHAEESLGHETRKVLAAVPASFGLRARDEFARAIERTGVQLNRLISEPCAAAVCGFHEAVMKKDLAGDAEDVVVLVIDIGGGTTDVATVEVFSVDDEIQIEVLSVGGNDGVAGIDFDRALNDFILERVHERAHELDLVIDLQAEQQLISEAERLKIRLSTASEGSVVLSNLDSSNGLMDLEVVVSREDFVMVTRDLILRIENCIEDAVSRATTYFGNDTVRGWDAIDIVMLAGMGGKIWPVRQLISRLTGNRNLITHHEESAVVVGLARYAAVLNGDRKNLLLIDALTSEISMDCEREIEYQDDERGQDEAQFSISPDEKKNGLRVRMVASFSPIPWMDSTVIEFADLGSPHPLKLYEKLVNGRTIELARLQISSPIGSKAIRVTLDISANTTVVMKVALVGVEDTGTRSFLLCGRHTEFGRHLLESGHAEDVRLVEGQEIILQ